MSIRPALLLAMALAWPASGLAHDASRDVRMSTIGSQYGVRVALGDFCGKVVAATFILASCTDACPLLTAKMAQAQNDLGADLGARIAFVPVTIDPERGAREVSRGALRRGGVTA